MSYFQFRKFKINYFYLFVLGFFLITVGHLLFANYMFMDGLYYTTIARNISVGDCSVWNLKFTNTVFTSFHEHPPLAMWIESFYFDLFGTHWFVDKFFSFSTYLVTVFILHKTWKLLYPTSGASWVTVLFWLFTPVVSWSVANNMLENTLTIFMLLAVYFLIKVTLFARWYDLLFAGICISLGFLTKGFVAFFPLSFFFIYFIIHRGMSFGTMVAKSILLLVYIILPLLFLFLINHASFVAIQEYINIQVVNSLKNIVTVESRFFIVKRLFSELLVMFILLALLYFYTRKKNEKESNNQQQKKWSLFLIVFGLTGVLPILISMKQSGYYILPTYPIFALGLCSLFYDRIHWVHAKLASSGIFKKISLVFFVVGVVYSLTSITRYGKDEVVVKDIKKISSFVKKGTIINTPTYLQDDYSIHAYFYRFNFVSLDCNDRFVSNYYLVNIDEVKENVIDENFREVPLKTSLLKLYRRKKQSI